MFEGRFQLLHSLEIAFHFDGVFCQLSILFLYLAVLFEEFIEEHRVHGLVADGVRLALVVAGDEIGSDFGNLFRNQAELRDAGRIKLVLITEGDRLEIENGFARPIHRFDVALEAR